MLRWPSSLPIMAVLHKLVHALWITGVSWGHCPHVATCDQEWSLPASVGHVVAWCAEFTTCLLVSLSPRHLMEQAGCGGVIPNCSGAARIIAGGDDPVECTDSSHHRGLSMVPGTVGQMNHGLSTSELPPSALCRCQR